MPGDGCVWGGLEERQREGVQVMVATGSAENPRGRKFVVRKVV